MTSDEALWDKLALRLKSVAYRECRGRGATVVSVHLVLNDGNLLSFSRPRVVVYEPKDAATCEILAAILSDEQPQ